MKRRRILLSLALVLVAAIGTLTVLVRAVWNEEEAVHVTPSEIEDSTLVIGTHLIHLSALTDELYEIASDSAEESGQGEIYYKSELSGGTWFNITTASSLEDITTGGTPVQDSVIAELFFTHHTKSDGVTYDLRTGQPVNPYDIVDPYDIESLEELMPLKNQYEIIKELQGESQAGKDKVARVEEILSTEVKNDTTNECDTNLAALQRYCDVLSQNNAPAEQISEVQSVMSAVDATRRAEVFTTLETVLNEYAQELSSIQDTTTTTEGQDGEEGTTETQEGRAPDTELQSAVNDSLSNVQSSLVEQQGKMLAEGTTVMSALRYEYSQQLITSAQAGNDAACDTAVASLIHLTNISSSIVADKEGELALLNDTVVPRAEQAYRDGLRAGVSTDYVQAAASNSSSALLNNLISTNASTVNTYRNELESYLTAVVLRLSNSEGMDYLNQRLEDAQNFYNDVPNDDFSESVRTTVDSHIEFLTNKLRELELAAGGNELDQLIAEKQSLQTDYMAALDNNDLTEAKAIEEQISALDDQIAQQQAAQADELNAAQSKLSDLEEQLANAEAGSSEAADLEKQIAAQKAEISALESNMSDGSLGELVATLKAECLSIIGNSSSGDPERTTLKNDIDTLVSLLDQNVKLVFPALQEIHEAMTTERDLNGDSSYGDEITTVEEAILGSKALYDAALSGSLSADQLQEIADAFLAGEGGLLDAGETDLSSLSDWEKNCVYLLALQRYYDATQGSAALQLLGSVSQQQVNLGSPLVFVQAQDPSMEYLPVKTAAQAAGLRYVWNQNKSQGTLAKGSLYYTFAAYSDLVQKGKDEESYERMTKAARLENGTLYLPEDYTLSAFSVEAQYLSATSYGVVVREDLSLLADELCSRFLAA
ncbi:hypothetical protein [Anaeromassilibacillus sp. An200]|uniref:hypothetical protein n=1 Tax=Anaeromassilibacillus sp. An200 TaxID=1965587 RepID=UPI000B39B765|nr:hypothetical protein [Anaeromassilibacillus sp. An200]OUP12790.1 hypothetical protein B5F35_06915 [Anaeromassilibacillus sp. An200]